MRLLGCRCISRTAHCAIRNKARREARAAGARYGRPSEEGDLQHPGWAWLAAAALAIATAGWLGGLPAVSASALVVGCASIALWCRRHRRFQPFTFAAWVVTAFVAALAFPAPFSRWGSFDLARLIVPLTQVIMFGMGATLSLGDFARALRMPRAVLVGMALQFLVMPVAGWTIATAFGFPPEIAAGIVLIGACSGGVASNVMTYLAKGNVALSVTMTACSTMMAPFVTPVAMEVLAGRLIEIQVATMMLSIVNLIILPIAAGLTTNHLLRAGLPGVVWRSAAAVAGVALLVLGRDLAVFQTQVVSLGVACGLMAAMRREWLDRALPLVSMTAICIVLAVIAANMRAEILAVGGGLFAAAILHNLIGYAAGYWGARASGISERDCRTVAFEVGMQNGGMGTALAIDVLRSAQAALGPAVFGTWMNISGSVLASWWRNRLPREPAPAAAAVVRAQPS